MAERSEDGGSPRLAATMLIPHSEFRILFCGTQKRRSITASSNGFRQRPTLPGRLQPSTIGTEGLNCCVRYGNRWDPFVITTGNCELFKQVRFSFPLCRFLRSAFASRSLPLRFSLCFPLRSALYHALRFLSTLSSRLSASFVVLCGFPRTLTTAQRMILD